MENDTRVISDEQENLFDELTQRKFAKKAEIGSGWYYSMLENAVAAGIVTDQFGTAIEDPDAITEDDLENLYFHFDNGAAYKLTFDASDGHPRVWLDEKHPFRNFNDIVSQAKVDQWKAEEEKKQAVLDAETQLIYDEMCKLDLHKAEDVALYLDAVQALVDRNAVFLKDNGHKYKMQSKNDVDLTDLSTLAIYPKKGDMYESPEKIDISDLMTTNLSGAVAPEKPKTWGRFQFLRRWADTVSTFFGGKGLKEYRDYEDKKLEYENIKYYTLTGANYSYKKSDALYAIQRERAVELYMQLNYGNLVDEQDEYRDLDFLHEENPLKTPDAEDFIRDSFRHSKNLNKFVNDPAVQNYLRNEALGKENGPNSVKELIKAGHEIAYTAIREYKDLLRSATVKERSQQAELKKLKAEAGREIENNLEAQRREAAAKVSYQVEQTLGLSVDNEKSRQFLNVIKETMSENTAEAWGVKHLVQDALKADEKDFLKALYDDFDPQAAEAGAKALKGLADPFKNGFDAINQYGSKMSPEFYNHTASLQGLVQNRYKEKSQPEQRTEKPAENVADKTMNGPRNSI